MNAANKRKIAEILKKHSRFPPKSELFPVDLIIELLNSVDLEVIERGHEEGPGWPCRDVSYRRLLPPPKDNKKSVCVKVWSYDGPEPRTPPLYPQIWVRLDRDVALKILILGEFPETNPTITIGA
jgi:hypothetical protein